jgi:hypothetical protein
VSSQGAFESVGGLDVVLQKLGREVRAARERVRGGAPWRARRLARGGGVSTFIFAQGRRRGRLERLGVRRELRRLGADEDPDGARVREQVAPEVVETRAAGLARVRGVRLDAAVAHEGRGRARRGWRGRALPPVAARAGRERASRRTREGRLGMLLGVVSPPRVVERRAERFRGAVEARVRRGRGRREVRHRAPRGRGCARARAGRE